MRLSRYAFLSVTVLLFSSGARIKMSTKDSGLKTYMSFVYPVDPSRATISTDADLSYSLCERLVDFDKNKHLVGGLVESWEFVGNKSLVFNLKNFNWSDGTGLTAAHVLRSLDRTELVHGKNLAAVFDLLESRVAVGEKSFRFDFKESVDQNNILTKLTEFMYGISWIDKDGILDLSKTLGPYRLQEETPNRLILEANVHSPRFSSDLFEFVEIRSSSQSEDPVKSLLNHEWSMVQNTSSLVAESDEVKNHPEIKIKLLNLTRTFLLTPNPQTVSDEHYDLLSSVRGSLDRPALLDGLGGFKLADQLFPKGSKLSLSKDLPPERSSKQAIWSKETLSILILEERVPKKLRENLKKELGRITGKKIELVVAPLEKFHSSFSGKDFDFYFGCIGVEDPNPDGVLSWLIEVETPILSSKNGNFKKRLKAAREIADQSSRNKEMAQILADATLEGHILPLFHYSISMLTGPEVNPSGVPITDEIMNFSLLKRAKSAT